MKIDKKSKFNTFLSGWQRFSDGSYVLSAELFPTKEDALFQLVEDFSDYPSDCYFLNFEQDEILADHVRFCCQGNENIYDGPACCWWLGAKGKGSKPVWTYKLKTKPGKSIYLP